MSARKPISTRERLRLFARKAGICHLCGAKILAGDAWDVSHAIPLELGGADDETNWDIAHRKCHRRHTAKQDIPAIARAKRREARHLGAKAPSRRPIPGSRNTKFRKRMDGTVVMREGH